MLLTHDLQYSLDKRAESRIISLDFSSTFDLVNHQGLLYKLKSIDIGGHVFNIFKDFLSNHKQHVLVDGNYSQFKPAVSRVPQGSVLDPLFFIIYTVDMWIDFEIKIILNADDTTLLKLHLPLIV